MSAERTELIREFCEGIRNSVAIFLDTNGIVGDDRSDRRSATIPRSPARPPYRNQPLWRGSGVAAQVTSTPAPSRTILF